MKVLLVHSNTAILNQLAADFEECDVQVFLALTVKDAV